MSSVSSKTRRDQLLDEYLAALHAARPTWSPSRRRTFNRMIMS